MKIGTAENFSGGAVFFDRDGTLGGNSIMNHPQEFSPYPFTAEAIHLLKSSGMRLFMFTNQSCIARGKDGGYDFDAEFRAMGMDDWFLCPHDDADACACRKPKPGLLLQAQEKYGLYLPHCLVVGDRWSDMAAGGAVGARLALVLTGRGRQAMDEDRVKWAQYQPDFVGETVLDVAKWVEQTMPRESGNA